MPGMSNPNAKGISTMGQKHGFINPHSKGHNSMNIKAAPTVGHTGSSMKKPAIGSVMNTAPGIPKSNKC